MNDSNIQDTPAIHADIMGKSREIGFTMPSDVYIGTLLKTLISSKPKGRFLELGTGIGLSLSWMLDGMNEGATLVTVDNDPHLVAIARANFSHDKRTEILCEDGAQFILNYKGDAFDLVFADAWPGKYSELDELLELVKIGGFYIIDDMMLQSNWPDGHDKKAKDLIAYLEEREDFTLTKMNWSTGLIIAVRIK